MTRRPWSNLPGKQGQDDFWPLFPPMALEGVGGFPGSHLLAELFHLLFQHHLQGVYTALEPWQSKLCNLGSCEYSNIHYFLLFF